MGDQKMYPKLDDERAQRCISGTTKLRFCPTDMQLSPIILQQPRTFIVQTPCVGPNPQAMIFPRCRNNINTSVEHEPTSNTHIFALLLCLCGCNAGCCLIPYCVDSCQAAVHSCPSCKQYLGRYDV